MEQTKRRKRSILLFPIVGQVRAKSIDNFLSLSSGIGANIIDSSDLFNLIQDKGVSTILELPEPESNAPENLYTVI